MSDDATVTLGLEAFMFFANRLLSRSRPVHLLFLYVLILFAWTPLKDCRSSDGLLEFKGLESEILANRNCPEGTVTLRTQIRDYTTDEKGPIKYNALRHISFTADGQWRCDTEYLDGDMRVASSPLRCSKRVVSNCVDGTLRFIRFDIIGKSQITPLHITNLQDMESLRPFERFADPRYLGLIVIDSVNLQQFDISSIFGRSDYTEATIETENAFRIPCKKISLLRKDGVTVRIYCAPQMGSNVIRIETESRDTLHRYDQSIESELARVESINNWYPKVCHYESRVDGKLVTSDETKVESVNFGKVAKSVFCLAALDIPVGGQILQIDNKGEVTHGTWDGHGISTKNFSGRGLTQSDGFGQGHTWFILINVALVVVLSVAIVLRGKRQRLKEATNNKVNVLNC